MNSMYLSVSEHVCVSCVFLFFFPICFIMPFFLEFVCFFSKHREKDSMELEGWGSGEDLGEDEGVGLYRLSNMYCMKEMFLIPD